MNKIIHTKWFPHLAAILVALVIIVAYFNPMLSGKVLKQHDVQQWQATYQEIDQYQKSSGERTFWTNSIFSGMPTYLIGPSYHNNFTMNVQNFISKVLPNPIDTVFLLFVCFYILMMAFEVSPLIAFIGSLAFMLSSFNFINIDAGHVGKGNAIAYIPLVLAGIQITLHRNKLFGALLTGIALSLELTAGHVQITYYLMFIVVAWMLSELIIAIKNKRMVSIIMSGVFMLIAAGIGVATNAASLMATEEYGKYSIRSKSELTKTASGESNAENATDGLDKDYALQYSYLPIEPLTILMSNIYGGAQYGELSTSSETYQVLKQNGIPNAKQVVQQMPLYWGAQPFTAGPTYYGAIICFLFVLGMFLVKGQEKWWILGVSSLAIALSMGRYFGTLTNIFFDYVPLYNKFRSVTFILAITQTTFPLLGVLALRNMMRGEIKKEDLKKALLRSFYIVGGLLLIFILMPELLFNILGIEKADGVSDYFISRADTQFPEWLRGSLIEDRKNLLRMDALRSFLLITAAAASLWFYLAGKLKQQAALGIIIGLVLFDLWQVDKRYLNDKDYQAKKKDNQVLFIKTQADEYILQDKDPNFRVYNTTQNLTQDALTSYYHKSIGGYNGAKMRRYQELIEFQLAKGNPETYNMLNVKYFIVGDSLNNLYPQRNPEANGNAWFVNKLVMVDNADAEMDTLSSLKTKLEAAIDKRFADQVKDLTISTDSSNSIKLLSYAPNKLVYESNASSDQFAVFSEMYYDKGWNATIDGKAAPYLRCDYVLRGMKVPSGKHTIEFKFEPEVVAKGESISLIASVLLYGGIVVIGGIGLVKSRKKEEV